MQPLGPSAEGAARAGAFTLRAAWKLDADEGIRKLQQYACWLEREWPSAAASLREGLSELFTVNRLGLPKALRRCLTTTNIITASVSVQRPSMDGQHLGHHDPERAETRTL